MKKWFSEKWEWFKTIPWWQQCLIVIFSVVIILGLILAAIGRVFFPKNDIDVFDNGDQGSVDTAVKMNEDKIDDIKQDIAELEEERLEIEDEIMKPDDGREDFHNEVDNAAANGSIAGIDAARKRRRRKRS